LEENAQRLGKRQLAELGLNLDSPAVNDTEKHVVTQIIDSTIGCLSQTHRLIMPPEKDMGIEEQSHASPSQKASGSGSSKSSAITIVPFPRPAIRVRGCCAIWVSASSNLSYSSTKEAAEKILQLQLRRRELCA
jgi:hypothetical protein